MTTASAPKIGRRPTSSSPASRAPPRPRPASISPIAATRSPTSRWCPRRRRRPRCSRSSHPLVVGLTTNPDRLVQIRRNRLLALNQAPETDYVDIEAVNAELAFARRLFADNDWPVIDVTRRSIEETAFAIVKLCNERMDATAAAGMKARETPSRLEERGAPAYARSGRRAVRGRRGGARRGGGEGRG
jgi:hypothetical protein